MQLIPMNRLGAIEDQGAVTFGSFNNFSKLSPGTIALWAELLRSLPESRLVLKAKQSSDEETVARLRKELLKLWIWLAFGIAILLFLPNIIWQIQHHWPTIEDLANVRNSGKNVVLGPLAFVAQQIKANGWHGGGTPEEWANESLKLAKQAWLPDGGAADEAYYKANIGIVDQQLAVAG